MKIVNCIKTDKPEELLQEIHIINHEICFHVSDIENTDETVIQVIKHNRNTICVTEIIDLRIKQLKKLDKNIQIDCDKLIKACVANNKPKLLAYFQKKLLEEKQSG